MKRMISLLCAFSMLFMLAGCSKKGPEGVVSRFCDAAKKFDVETMSDCVANSEEKEKIDTSDVPKNVIAAFMEHTKNITYEIGEAAKTETEATVPVEVTYPDLKVAIGKAIGEYVAEGLGMAIAGADDEEMEDLFESVLVENLAEAEPKLEQMSIEFKCVMTEDGWKIQMMPEDILNILLGNMIQALEELESA